HDTPRVGANLARKSVFRQPSIRTSAHCRHSQYASLLDRTRKVPMSQNLTFRLGRMLAALAFSGALGLATSSAQAQAWTAKRLAAQEHYLACRTRIQQQPPCNQNWTRYCARYCHARYY